MLLRYFYDERLAQASYLVGCVATGEAMVVDPNRNSAAYVAAAEKEGLRITHVTETHIHADFVSGSRELAAATDATIFLSSMGGEAWQYDYRTDPHVVLVQEGDSWMVGNIKVAVMHVPGHTPEQMALVITDTAATVEPMGVFTGDFLFVGDVGRPDLLETAAGQVGTKEAGAKQQFQSVQRFKELPDYLQIWPGHGAGSACGKALGAVPSTTLGYEKRFNPAFQFAEEAAFTRWLLADQPEPPRYFAQMKRVNKAGPALLATLPPIRQLDRLEIDQLLAADALVVDLRSRADYAAAHLPGTISISAHKNFSTYVGYFVDYDAPCAFVAPAEEAVDEVVAALRAIGVDQISGYALPAVVESDAVQLPEWSADELAAAQAHNGLAVIDVRNRAEYVAEHIQGAKHIQLGQLPQRLAEIPRDRPVITQCASGYRSQIAASLLRAQGFDNVRNLRDGKEQWSRALATTSGE